MHEQVTGQVATNEDEMRREFWAEQMDEAYEFMDLMRSYPIEECGEGLRFLPEAVAESGVEVEFSTSKIARDFDRMFYLREGLVPGFIRAAGEMNERGWKLKVEDGFRTIEMQRSLSRKPSVFDAILKTTIWECGGRMPDPDFLLRRIAALTAIRPKVGTHMSGSALDISVFHRESGEEIVRGGPYLEMSELTPMASPFISLEAQENRREITDIMRRCGFIAYPFEFWHYNAGDCYGEFLTQSGKPGRYGAIHLDVESGTVTPVENPDELLQPLDVVRHEIEQARKRLQSR